MTKQWLRWAVVSVSASLLAGASCDKADAGSKVCDPLATGPVQTAKLGEILGVGRDDKGTLYVADEVASESEPRVFISDAGMLVRHRVLGSGNGNADGARFVILTVEAEPQEFTLAIEITAKSTRMATIAGNTKAPSFDALENRHALEVLDAGDVADLPLSDLPAEVDIEYVARTKSGELMLVIRPRDNWGYDDFRLFYGEPPRLLERRVGSVERQRDGGSTQIEFQLDGMTATADFPVVSDDTGFKPGPATLEVGSKKLALVRLDAASSSLGGAELHCFE